MSGYEPLFPEPVEDLPLFEMVKKTQDAAGYGK
jgi:hypothetical protein